MFVLIGVGLALGVPVAFTLLGGVFAYFVTTPIPDGIFIQRAVAGVQSFPLLAVPFFVLAGTAMAKGGIARRLLVLAGLLAGTARGALAQINVISSLFLSGISGSANADAAIGAKVLVPPMVRTGYSRGFAAAITAATGMIAPVVPPSIGLIIYGLIAEVSVGRLFLAGVIPGILMATALMVSVRFLAIRRGYGRLMAERPGWREIAAAFREAAWALMLPVFVYRELKPSEVLGVLKDAAVTTALIMFIVAAGSAMSYVVTWERMPQHVIAWLTGITENPVLLLLLINLILLVLGMFMESVALLVIVTPIVVPLLNSLGIDLVHFGIVLIVNLTVGGITPPIGTVMYTVLSITRASVGEFTRAVLPLLLTLILVLLALTFVPALSLFLPNLLLG